MNNVLREAVRRHEAQREMHAANTAADGAEGSVKRESALRNAQMRQPARLSSAPGSEDQRGCDMLVSDVLATWRWLAAHAKWCELNQSTCVPHM
eukprot:917917-Rhodomonas_salina.1